MSVTATVLFGKPQHEIQSLIEESISKSLTTSIVTGFATPGGLKAIEEPIKAVPGKISTIIVGAATYPGFVALDDLNAAGVPLNRLFIHLGHTRESGTYKNPVVRFHPMLHSKIFYMEFPDAKACAFIGSHNMTSFALKGLNGEAGVMLEGPSKSPEFQKVRDHIEEAKTQAVNYSPGMKDAYAWWAREYLDGMKAEMKIPIESTMGRTILIFAKVEGKERPQDGHNVYFEIPAGIDQIESMKTEMHLFLFATLPADPWTALNTVPEESYTCQIQGVENEQGNREVAADWRITGTTPPVLHDVPTKRYRPLTRKGKQQVRAKVMKSGVTSYEYFFEQKKDRWEPLYSDAPAIYGYRNSLKGNPNQKVSPDPDDPKAENGWKLVTGLVSHDRSNKEKDMKALELVLPDSGSFILVSLRKSKKA